MPDQYLLHDVMLDEAAGEGELPVDVCETQDELMVYAPIAGVDPDAVSIAYNGDVITIRGTRTRAPDLPHDTHFFSDECAWGSFSRSIVIPVDVRLDDARAEIANGMLTIRIPKQLKTKHIPIVVIDEP